jgi:hypothetical protein
MGRPIKKRFFGNSNQGSTTTNVDDYIGGEGIASIKILNTTTNGPFFSTATIAFSNPQLPYGVKAEGRPVVVDGKITEIIIDTPGSGYTSTATVTITWTGGQQGFTGLGYVVSLTAVQFNSLGLIAFPTWNNEGLYNSTGTVEVGDIVKQTGSKRYYIETQNAYGVCTLVPHTPGYEQMAITALDWYGNTYWVTKISGNKAGIVRQTQNTSTWVYLNSDVARWSIHPATGTNRLLATTAIQIINA